MKISKALQYSFLGGIYEFFRWLPRGVRFHPSSRIIGDRSAVTFGRGAKIGQGCLFVVSSGGRIEVGAQVWMYRDAEIRCDGGVVAIGDTTTLQKGVTLNGDVSIGRGCILAPNVFISSGTHQFSYRPELSIREQDRLYHMEKGRYSMPVTIDDDCWIGINAVIVPGVRIGQGAVVGANAVVTKSFLSRTVCAGVPARRIKMRDDE